MVKRLVSLFCTVSKYAPAGVAGGRLAVIAVLLDWVTVKAVVPSKTLGSFDPKPVPLMVIWVPWMFSVTSKMIGSRFSCAVTMTGQTSSNEISRHVRLSMDNLLSREPAGCGDGCALRVCKSGGERDIKAQDIKEAI
jgi:hypothetical protein